MNLLSKNEIRYAKKCFTGTVTLFYVSQMNRSFIKLNRSFKQLQISSKPTPIRSI